MNTEMLSANKSEDINLAAQCLQAGMLVAVPTETVYGLAADATNVQAVAAIFAAKGRPVNHPLIVHIAHEHQLADWATNIPDAAYLLARAFWPGPLTLLLHKAPHVLSCVTGGKETLALRVPAHPAFQQLLLKTGLGLAAPSANRYQKVSTTSAKQVYAQLKGKVDKILDGGDCSFGLESTIVDLTSREVRILRSGPITASQIADVLGCVVLTPEHHEVAISGNQQVHYQPQTPLYICSRQQLVAKLQEAHPRVAGVFYGQADASCRAIDRYMPANKADYARLLYKTLHELDELDIDEIYLEQPPESELWLDVNDRLRRAQSFKLQQ